MASAPKKQRWDPAAVAEMIAPAVSSTLVSNACAMGMITGKERAQTPQKFPAATARRVTIKNAATGRTCGLMAVFAIPMTNSGIPKRLLISRRIKALVTINKTPIMSLNPVRMVSKYFPGLISLCGRYRRAQNTKLANVPYRISPVAMVIPVTRITGSKKFRALGFFPLLSSVCSTGTSLCCANVYAFRMGPNLGRTPTP